MSAPTSIPGALQRRPASPLVAELSAAFDAINDEPLLAALAAYRWTGRPGWSLRAMWRAQVAAYVLNCGTTNDLIRRLDEDEALRSLCGFDGLPSRWTFNRFVSRLSQHTELVQVAIAGLTDRLASALPDFGKGVAVDASVVRTWADPDRKPGTADPEASFTRKNNSHGKETWYYGYKLHLAVDAKYEIPITASVTTGSAADSGQLIPLIHDAYARHGWFAPEYVTADAGYDTVAIAETLTRFMNIAPVIAIRNMPRKNAPDPEDPRHFPPIGRGTPEWKKLYATRTSVERCFSRLKSHRALNSHCRRGLRKIALHALMSVLAMQVTAVVRAEAGLGGVRDVSRRVA